MKAQPPDDQDAALAELLKEWRVKPSLPPRFEERVWRRIASAQPAGTPQRSWVEGMNWISRWLGQPRLAAGYLAALLVLGFAVGWTRGLEKSTRVDQALRSRYVQVIDPYQGSRH